MAAGKKCRGLSLHWIGPTGQIAFVGMTAIGGAMGSSNQQQRRGSFPPYLSDRKGDHGGRLRGIKSGFRRQPERPLSVYKAVRAC